MNNAVNVGGAAFVWGVGSMSGPDVALQSSVEPRISVCAVSRVNRDVYIQCCVCIYASCAGIYRLRT
jgi:hypothetical protein